MISRTGRVGHPINDQVEELPRSGIDPVDILEHHERWQSRRQSLNLRHQRLEGLLLPLLRGQVRAAGSGRRSGSTADPRSEGTTSLKSLVACASTVSSLSSRSSACRRAETRPPVQAGAIDRVKRAVLVMRRAEIAQAGVRFVASRSLQCCGDAAICRCPARPRTARPGPRRPSPAASGAAAVRAPLPSDQRHREPAQAPRSGSRRARAEHLPCRTGSAKPLSGRAKILKFEEAAGQPARDSAITTVSGSASVCSRAARFGVSPTTACSCAAPRRSGRRQPPARWRCRRAACRHIGARQSAPRPRRSPAPRAPPARRRPRALAGSQNRRAPRRPCIWRRSRRTGRSSLRRG